MKKYLLLLLALLPLCAHAEWELILEKGVDQIASDGERLYAATEYGIYYSRDDGRFWRRSDYRDYILNLTAAPGVAFGWRSDRGILRSVTKGNTWHWKNNGFKPTSDGHHLYYPEVLQFVVAESGMVIAVGYHSGTWISRDRGDSWHEVTHEWTIPGPPGYSDIRLGTGIWSMGEHDGYLWAAYSSSITARSPDEGAAWELGPTIDRFARAEAWVSYRGDLYMSGGGGFGRFNELAFEWEDLSRGLPQTPRLNYLVVHRDRIFGGSRYGLFMFDHHAETWYPAGLSDMDIRGLVSHRGNLYAVGSSPDHMGLYRAKRPFVSPEGKAAVTWGTLKTK